MSKEVLIVGANGRFGRAAVNAFLAQGWRVRAFVRAGKADRVQDGITIFEGDATDECSLAPCADGADVIVNALNPPYPSWQTEVPRITASILAAARSSGATVMIPGNVYNYGAQMPVQISEETPHRPTARKGRIREEMEAEFRRAADEGVQTIILRGGDFIERTQTGNWFDTYISSKVEQGKVTYPGPLDRVHAWAYLPDMARAMVGLAEQRASLRAFETIGFGGYALTGAELKAAMEQTAGRPLKVKSFPWLLMRLVAPFNALVKEVIEMEYLWRVPHAIDGSRLAALLPDFRPTPLDKAMAEALG